MSIVNNFSERLHKAIPGGCHTYSRGDDQFPNNAPAILKRGKGAYVWDDQDNSYLDYGMGLRSVNIGYGNIEVADAVYKEILNGNNLTRASLIELEAAEKFIDIIPSAEMVKFAKHGSVVTTAAIKLARAYTGKKYVCIPGQQPFFSYDDWFIGTTVIKKGTLPETSDFTLKFEYNNIESLNHLFDVYGSDIACVMMEPATTLSPLGDKATFHQSEDTTVNFLKSVQEVCKKFKALFIIDEMITGFRWHLQGAQTFYGIDPDLSTFGKAMANGFAVAALCGKRDIMNAGSILNEGQERTFLTSTTHGAEMSGMAAFLKTVELLKRDNIIDHFWKYGESFKTMVKDICKGLGIEEYFYLEGYPCSMNYITKDSSGQPSMKMRTLFAQTMIDEGVMIPYLAFSFSHQKNELEKTFSALTSALKIYKMALVNGSEKYLKSSIIKPVFRQFN